MGGKKQDKLVQKIDKPVKKVKEINKREVLVKRTAKKIEATRHGPPVTRSKWSIEQSDQNSDGKIPEKKSQIDDQKGEERQKQPTTKRTVKPTSIPNDCNNNATVSAVAGPSGHSTKSQPKKSSKVIETGMSPIVGSTKSLIENIKARKKVKHIQLDKVVHDKAPQDAGLMDAGPFVVEKETGVMVSKLK